MTRPASARALVALLLAALLSPSPGQLLASPEAERLRAAKALFFDGSYEEARREWEAVRAQGGPEARDAVFWIARCSEKLGALERALGEYQSYLDARPANQALAEEARTARVGLAFKLYQRGQHHRLEVLHKALADRSRSVRYVAAFQLAQLGPEAGSPALPVLREILAQEKDPDLVDRARLALLRLDAQELRDAPARVAGTQAPGGPRSISWVKVRIYEKSQKTPSVSINLPVALADLVFKSLPDDAREKLRRKGYDADNFWRRLKALGPTEIVTIQGDDGERIQIWTE